MILDNLPDVPKFSPARIHIDKELDELELRYKKLVQKGNTTEEEDLDDIERQFVNLFGDVQSKNINFKPAGHGLNVIDPEDVEIQVLEDRLEKLIEGMNLIRNEWVKVHGK